MTTRVIAHRGSSELWAEHTRSAYGQAIADGADGIECDVRLSADGEVVCFHDPSLDRTSNERGPLHERTLAELRELDVTSWKTGVTRPGSGTPTEQLMTLLDLVELMRRARRELILAIELKHPNPFGLDLERRVLEVLEAAEWNAETGRIDQVLVSFMSFNPETVELLAPTVPRGHLVMLTADIELADIAADIPADQEPDAEIAAMLRAAIEGGRQLIAAGAVGTAGPSLELVKSEPDLVRGWLAAGLRVRVWTVDDAADVDFCVALGIQEITTNRPAEVLTLLAERKAAERTATDHEAAERAVTERGR